MLLQGGEDGKNLCLEIENLISCSGPADFFLTDLGK